MEANVEFSAVPDWSASEWMRERLDLMAARVVAREGDYSWITNPDGQAVLSIPLNGLLTDTGSEEDLTCDKCDKVFPDGLWGFVLAYPLRPGFTILVSGGLCDDCAIQEKARD
jgi:hypothetical protein